ncbi:hypothetical protein, partial [Bradyrhizobium sp. NAS96.2]|uniref:hypothetical protein n=1 Tax=Bradyrhizobium sp. NAS96.2 TaxID=1680160 RepID=UPI000968D6C8
MNAESGKSLQQIIAEQEARLLEQRAKLDRFKEVGAEFQRLATELGITIPSLDFVLGVPSAPPPMPKEEFKSSAATNASSTSGITLGELVEQ